MPESLRLRYLLLGGLLCVLILLLGTLTEAQATHIRAGDITAMRDTGPNPNPRKFFFTMIMYTNQESSADDPFVDISLGDGNMIRVQRKSVTAIGNQTDKEVFEWEYTYGADGTYTISWNGINRNANIQNIAPPSDQLSFYISTTININSLRGFNSTPILTVAPIDLASVGKKFVHNPGAYDRDGDSLAFKLRVPLRKDNAGNIVAVPGYSVPNRTFNCPNSTGAGTSTFTLNVETGQMVWDAPCRQGEYNVAFVVEEWRITANGGAIKLGEVVRDMQIFVVDAQNDPPVLTPLDTCVIAGTTFSSTVRATDKNGDLITLTATSGILPPATFTQLTNTAGLATGRFTWSTECADVRERPYQVIFKAEDQLPLGRRLADLQPWNIRVVGPPPQNLRAESGTGRTIVVSWDKYVCQNAEVMKIYRREGPSNFVPDKCQTGVPASTGYVKIGEVRKATNGTWATSFTDNSALKAGVQYCYIIYAEFPSPGRGKSIASREVCVMVDQDIPYLTNVTVDRTSTTAGQITVKWTKPQKTANLKAPLQYKLYRAEGQQDVPAAQYTLVKTANSLADTTYVDRNLNTTEKAYRYKLEFYQSDNGTSSNVLHETTSGSSVFLTVTPSATDEKSIALNWTYRVPWNNQVFRHRIYRREIGSANYVLIDSVMAGATSGTYTDRGSTNFPLNRGKEYCYYIQTRGTYQLSGIKEPLINNSQEVCAKLNKLVCPPELSIDQLDCNAFQNNPTDPPYQNVLTWVPNITGDCTDEIKHYTVYFKGPGETDYKEIAKVPATAENRYVHRGLDSFAGCYVVTATDVNNKESELSNEVCKDNCFFFMLPNIITPNGDNLNDVFRPDRRSRFIKSVKFTVFNRWGVKVYEGNDVGINWPGTDKDGNRLTDGTYYYEAQVEFISLDPANASKKYKGWVEIVR
jgi:gliding motility-associated-like protein